ncbi:hypothetical protein [Mesorhizobium wenxiniae]|uniref:Phosphoribosylformylglycinamidine synthase n=1 Tax=Mesorhizobium wenxiniae TaxID=2014805 RepID=A0A271KDX8_9HYPH|nr:hypothetical protein [Mesorhizobium wenxiniae]PAP93992.1 phosphoribosylformylglycinamidine synthase [Mesorhizobium wenxiniae]
MTSNVLKFEPVEIGEGFRFDSDEILEGAKGQVFTTLAILGQLEDGSIWVSGNANAGETLVLMERAKHHLVFGEDE